MLSSLYALAIPAIVLPVVYRRYLTTRVIEHQDPNPEESIGIFGKPKVLAQVDRIKSVATAERPKLPSDRSAWAMAWLHAIIWHSFKSMYYNADKILPGDYASYREYALLTIQNLVDHHDSEEEVLFPILESKSPGSMKLNEAQHAIFLPRLTRMKEYLVNATEESKFDPHVFRELTEPLVLPLFTHLADELDTLQGDKLREVCTEEELMALSKASHPPSNADMKYKTFPFMLQSLPPTAAFPPIPGMIKHTLLPLIYGRKHQNLWPYTAFPWTNKTGYTVPQE